MRNNYFYKNSIFIVSFLIFTSALISCTMEDNINAKKTSITALIQSQPNLSTLSTAIDKSGLSSTLDAQGTYTLFAPTNDAFAIFLADNGFSSINDVPTATLKQILLNHVIGSVLNESDLPSSGYIKTLAIGSASTTNTLSMYVNKSTNGVVINNISIVTNANVLANNGIVHFVNKVLALPTLTDHLKSNPNLSSLVSTLSGTGQPDFFMTLSGSSVFTVFAPVNTAFTSLNTELLGSGGIAGVSSANITKILLYHVTSGNVLASDLTNGELVTTLQAPQTFTVQLSSSPKLKDVNNRSSNIITTDIQCSNGVIHLLNKALLPTF